MTPEEAYRAGYQAGKLSVPEIVRCKDCQYLSSTTTFSVKGVPFCKHIKKFVDADWFCADGERKNNNG